MPARRLPLGLLLVLLCAACQGRAAQKDLTRRSAPTPAALAASLPALPPPHAPSAIVAQPVKGYNYYLAENALGSGQSVSLVAPPDGLAWAMYQFTPAANTLQSLAIDGSIGLDQEAWVAVSNYVEGVWSIHGPYAGFQDVPLSDAANKSPLGTFYCAVITFDGLACSVNRLECRYDDQGLNPPPTAALTATPPDGTPPLPVQFDAGGSSDPGGGIINYEWDFDGDNAFSASPEELLAEGSPSAQYQYDQAGVYYPAVRVTDTNWATDTISETITVYGWADVYVDDEASYPALYPVNGAPSLAYTRSDPGSGAKELKFALAASAVGASAGEWQAITLGLPPGAEPGMKSLANIDGSPSISFYDEAASSLHYAFASTINGGGAADWNVIALTPPNGATGGNWLRMLSSFPAVAYIASSPDREICYRVSSTARGTNEGDWSTVVVDSLASSYPQLGYVISDKPVVVYKGEGRLYFAYSSTLGGDTGAAWNHFELDSTDGSGSYCSYALIDDRPMIAYQSGDNTFDLRIAYSSTAEASSPADWHSFDLQTTGDVGGPCALFNWQGYAALFYWDATSQNLMFTAATTVDGDDASEWTAPEALANVAGGLRDQALSAVNMFGKPACAYVTGSAPNQLHYLVNIVL